MKLRSFAVLVIAFFVASSVFAGSILTKEQKKYLETVLAGQADANSNFNGYLPLMLAVSDSNLEAVQKLLDLGADPKAYGVLSALMNGRAKKKGGIDVNDAAIIKLLVERGADPNKQPNLLHYCAMGKVNGVVRELLAAGADPNLINGDLKYTPIFLADSPEMIDIFLQAGANPYTKDTLGKYIFDYRYNDKNKKAYKHLTEFWKLDDPNAHLRVDAKKKAKMIQPGEYAWIREYRTTVNNSSMPFEIVYATINVPKEMTKQEAINTLVPADAQRWPMGRIINLERVVPSSERNSELSRIKDYHDMNRETYTERSY